ncbi:ABC transporter ATP-binding protein [Jiangella alkaliphila]|uniref:ABC-type quaternary amine transporter n=1 Tax=Jiangella alkaliphila TaxID=419479 RepID=A0A1H2LCC6_9ACTN|nr:ABC transporter ATP-binding protein [Jiangella alkaliphila]SDU78579.1 iron(III) transport system ATP-binding protein [Jiangella alkaliphila]
MTLELDRLVAGYRNGPVLHDVSLTVADRELLTVLGTSGSGKTTLLRTVAGLHRPDSGRITLNGRDVTRERPERRRIGLVPQEGALFGHLTVAQNVGFGLRGTSWPVRSRPGRVRELLELTGLEDLPDRMPHELSGGQRQRVALARALAPEPEVVLLDEPFAALDSSLRAGLRAQVRAALRESGATAVLITHDQDEALSISDRVAVLSEGRVVQAGTPRELYRRPRTLWLAGFVGDALILPGRTDGRSIVTVLGRLEHDPAAAGDATAVVRPEQLTIGAAAAAGVTATVEAVEYFGHDQLIHLRLADGTPALARTTGDAVATVGARVGVRVTGPVHVIDD